MRRETPEGFYVYTLSDPRNGKAFYVGKGKGRRAWQHEADVIGCRSSNAAKTLKINSILADGQTVSVAIIETYEFEADAYEHEIEMIAALPDLTNMSAGGEGFTLSPEAIKARAEARAKRIKERRKAQIHAAKNKQHERRSQAYLSMAGDRHRDEVEAWLSGLKTKAAVNTGKRGGLRVRHALTTA